MPIVLLRVDERLIHGQVVIGWGEQTHMDRLVVVDDAISASPWEQELYCLGVPPTMDALFLRVEDARQQLPRWREDARRVALLVRDCETVARLAEGGTLSGLELNLGGIHAAPGRERVLPYLFLSPADREALHRVAATGVKVSARDLPRSKSVPLDDLTSHA